MPSENPFKALKPTVVPLYTEIKTHKAEDSALVGLNGPLIEKIKKEFNADQIYFLETKVLDRQNLTYEILQFVEDTEAAELILRKMKEFLNIEHDPQKPELWRATANEICAMIKQNS